MSHKSANLRPVFLRYNPIPQTNATSHLRHTRRVWLYLAVYLTPGTETLKRLTTSGTSDTIQIPI